MRRSFGIAALAAGILSVSACGPAGGGPEAPALQEESRETEGTQDVYKRQGRKLSGFFQDILEKIKAFLFKDRIGLPGILGLIPLHNGCQGGLVCFFKLGFYGFCDFCGCVGIDVLQSLLDGICEFLYDFRIFFNIAFLCTICRVGHIAGAFSPGGRHMAVSFQFQGGGEGLELHGVCLLYTSRCV